MTFYADISSWQAPADDTYPYPVLAFRADDGVGPDSHAAHNWQHCQQKGLIAVAYVVFKPGHVAPIVNRLKQMFGPHPARLAVMVDMESGAEFAGPGNHSLEANQMVAELGAWLGPDAVLGYANAPDWAALWPDRPAGLKRIVAHYGAGAPNGAYGWQYFGGVDNPTAVGFPRSCPPFGGNVDLNYINRTVAQIEADFGFTPKEDGDLTPEEHAWLENLAKNDIPLPYKQHGYNLAVQTLAAVNYLRSAVADVLAKVGPKS